MTGSGALINMIENENLKNVGTKYPRIKKLETTKVSTESRGWVRTESRRYASTEHLGMSEHGILRDGYEAWRAWRNKA